MVGVSLCIEGVDIVSVDSVAGGRCSQPTRALAASKGRMRSFFICWCWDMRPHDSALGGALGAYPVHRMADRN